MNCLRSHGRCDRGFESHSEHRCLVCTRVVPKVSILISLCMTWERNTSLIHICELGMTLAACTYLFKLDRFSLSWAIAVCVRSCFITSVTFAMQPWYCSQRIFTSRTDSLSRILQRCLGKTGDWVLNYDKAPANTALLVRKFLAKKTIPTLPHPPYSPHLAPCDHFGTVENTRKIVTDKLRTLTENDFRYCYDQWKERWNHCVTSQGPYFEGYNL
jgi:hypothetical protein